MDLNKLLRTLDTISEGTMKSAEKKPTGPKFVGKWKGTDSASQAKDKLVGESNSLKEFETESRKRTLEWALKEEYEKFISEYGMTTGGMKTPTAGETGEPDDAATKSKQIAMAQKDTSNIQKTLQSIKNIAPDLNVSKTATALSKAETDQDLSNLDKDASSDLAEPIGDIAKDPQLAGQFKQLIQKAQQKDKMQQAKDAAQQAQQGTGTV